MKPLDLLPKLASYGVTDRASLERFIARCGVSKRCMARLAAKNWQEMETAAKRILAVLK